MPVPGKIRHVVHRLARLYVDAVKAHAHRAGIPLAVEANGVLDESRRLSDRRSSPSSDEGARRG